MEVIKPFIYTRLELLNNTEPKDSIVDVVFTIKLLNGEINESNIYLLPYEEIFKASDKEVVVQKVFDKIIDRTFFKEKNLGYNDIDIVLFFSFDYLNLVDNCYIISLEENDVVIQVHDLNGVLILEKNLLKEKFELNKKVIKKPSISYLFFDTETTGLPKNWKAPVTDLNNWPRLVQLAYLGYDCEGNKISSGDFIIKPDGFTIPKEASRVHGISNEVANKEGESISSVLEHFNSMVEHATYLVAHNISFDANIVGSELIRNGFQNSIQSKRKICTMESTTNFCAISGPYGYKWPKLSELHFKLFRTGFEEAHNAAVDIAATAKCFWELKKLRII